MRILGIDYGTKRIGLAVSDENQSLAFPREILFNDAKIFKKLEEFLKKENIKEIVIGESVNFKGEANSLSARIELFIKELENRYKIPIRKQKEFLTSVEARRDNNAKKNLNLSQSHNRVKKIKKDYIDASAAALILQRYLDRKNKYKVL